MYSTIAAVIDQPVPEDEDLAEDSFNVLPAILETTSPNPLRSSMIVHSPNGNFAIRRGVWKYIEGKAGPTLKKVSRRDELSPQLYHLEDDPAEQNNILGEHPGVASHLSELLNAQRNSGRTR